MKILVKEAMLFHIPHIQVNTTKGSVDEHQARKVAMARAKQLRPDADSFEQGSEFEYNIGRDGKKIYPCQIFVFKMIDVNI